MRRDGHAFIPHLGGFIVALREELDSPGGLTARNPPSVERRPYRMDVKPDGSGIERYVQYVFTFRQVAYIILTQFFMIQFF